MLSFVLDPKVKSVLRKVLGIVVATFIGYQVWQIGWTDVLKELPTHPGFYILIPILFLSLPAVEVLIYRRIWNVGLWRAFLVKKVFNEEVAGYSGEVYLFTKIHEVTGENRKHIGTTVRDINILSAIASYFIAFVLLLLLLARDVIPLGSMLSDTKPTMIGIAFVTFVALMFLAIRFRSYLFKMSLAQSLPILGLYLTRFSLHHSLLVFQWSLVMPETPWDIWLIYVALAIILNRIPFLPGKELVFVWAGIELSHYLDMASSGVAGMLLVSGAANRLLNLGMYLWLKGKASTSVSREIG
jgi:hypothetical protein